MLKKIEAMQQTQAKKKEKKRKNRIIDFGEIRELNSGFSANVI